MNQLAPEPIVGPVETRVGSADGFRKWLKEALPGDRAIYFEGYLAEAVEGLPRGPVEQLRRHAYDAFTAGSVHLFQRRREAHLKGFSYIAVKKGARHG